VRHGQFDPEQDGGGGGVRTVVGVDETTVVDVPDVDGAVTEGGRRVDTGTAAVLGTPPSDTTGADTETGGSVGLPNSST